MIRQAVILCGGKGTRLGDLTKETPKPLLKVGDRPFIEHLMQEITRYGISEIVLLTGHLGDQFEVYHNTSINRARIRVHKEAEPLGTWGSVNQARELLDPWFLLLNGDSWLDYNLTKICKKRPRGIHMVGRFIDKADRYETLDIVNGRVENIIARGEVTQGIINSGIYVVNSALVDTNDTRNISLEQSLLPKLAGSDYLTADVCEDTAYFIDIGIPSDYIAAQTSLVAQRTRPALFVDRDNCLTYDHKGYTHHPDDMEFKPGAVELINCANQNGWYVFVVTNQGGVTKGKYLEHYILDFHRKMQYTLAITNNHVDALEYEIELVSHRRKPGPGMLTDLMREWLIDTKLSFMIGDKTTDAEAGHNAGISGYQIDDTGNLLEQFGEFIVRK